MAQHPAQYVPQPEMYYPVPAPPPAGHVHGYYPHQQYFVAHPAFEPRHPPRYQPYSPPTYSEMSHYSPNYERRVHPSNLPEPVQQDLPIPRNTSSSYQQPPSPYNEKNFSAESSMRASPMSPVDSMIPPHLQGMTEAERKKYEQNERRKKRNREAQQKARQKQKDTIETLKRELHRERQRNDSLETQLSDLQRELEAMRNNINIPYQM